MPVATPPTVARLVATMEHDQDSDPYDMRTRFHWERFGREVEIDDSEYVSPFDRFHTFDFDDEDHPIYTLQKGARLVIDDSMRFSDDHRPAAEILKELKDDAWHIRTWLEDKWHYVVLKVEATITTTVNGHEFTDTEAEYLGGVEDGLGGLHESYTYAQEQAYQQSQVADMVSELKSRLAEQGIVWPDDLEVEYK